MLQYQKQAKKRRRVATASQRRAANIRERRRMFNLNESFDRLRSKVRIETLLGQAPGCDLSEKVKNIKL